MRLIGYKYFSPECDSIRQIHLQREDYNLANIPRMMSKIYADNFARSKSDSSRGSAERGVATKAIGQDLINTNPLYWNKFGYSKNDCADLQAGSQEKQRRRQRQHK